MFNLQNLLGFIKRFLMDFIPLALFFLLLAFLTELVTHWNQWPGVLLTWQFWVGVGLNMVPAIIITFIVFFLASRFMKSVYGLQKRREGIDFLARSRFGQAGFSPFVKIGGGQIIVNADGILTRIGGPGSLIINHDSAVVLEKAGRLHTEVKGPGFHKLDRFQKIYDIVDLQPKQWVLPVKAMTKEGIPITWDVEIRYQINNGDQVSSPERPYPFLEPAVFQAATCKWRRETTRRQDMDWEGKVVGGATEGALRSILARRHLDELIGLTEAEEQAVRETIQAELEETVQKSVPLLGARILGVKLANLQVRDGVTQEWIEAWRTRWQGWSQIRLGEGEAERVFLHETVKAEAQVQYIIQITQALQEEDISPEVLPATLSMRLFSVLDRARAAQMRGMGEYPLSQIWDMSNQIRELLGEANRGKVEESRPGQVDGSLRVLQARSSSPAAGPPRARIIPFRLPVIDEIAAGKARIVSDEIIDFIQVGRLEADGQAVAIELLKGSQVVLYPEYRYFAAKFPEDCLEGVDICAEACVILQKPKWSALEPETGDIVAVLSRDGRQKITLRPLEIDGEQGVEGEIIGVAIAQLKPTGVAAPAGQIDRSRSALVSIIPIIDPRSAGKATPGLNDVTGYVYANDFEHEEHLLKAEPLKGDKISFQPGNDYCIMRVSGDSMDQAGISGGDYVILQKVAIGSPGPTTGDIVAAVFRDGEDNRATLKRFGIRSGQVTLKPESSNPEHQPVMLPARAFAGNNPQATICGIAIAVLKPQ